MDVACVAGEVGGKVGGCYYLRLGLNLGLGLGLGGRGCEEKDWVCGEFGWVGEEGCCH